MFIDASAFCAILLGEPDGKAFQLRIAQAAAPRTSPIAVWETVRALVRETGSDVPLAWDVVRAFLEAGSVEVISIGEAEQHLALAAFDRFGKGRHPAQLNMGDCFAYACARSLGARLMFKGDDFARTDIDPA